MGHMPVIQVLGEGEARQEDHSCKTSVNNLARILFQQNKANTDPCRENIEAVVCRNHRGWTTVE